MKEIEERAIRFADEIGLKDRIRNAAIGSYMKGAIDQRKIDLQNCIRWCEDHNKEADSLGFMRIDTDSFRQWIKKMISYKSEEYD